MRASVELAYWLEQNLPSFKEVGDISYPVELLKLNDLLQGKLSYQKTLQQLENYNSQNIALNRLISIFNLDQTEILILLVCCASELIPSMGRLCGNYHNCIERNTPTFSLIASLFDNFDWKVTNKRASLLEWQLIEVNPVRSSAHKQSPIRIDSSILHYLLEMNYFDENLDEVINYTPFDSHVVDTRLIDKQSQGELINSTVETIVAVLERSTAEEYGTLIQLTGTDTDNKDSTVRAVAQRLGSSIIELDEFAIPAAPEQISNLAKRLKRWLKLERSLLHIKADGLIEEDKKNIKAIARLIESIGMTLIISTVEPTKWSKDRVHFEVATPDFQDQVTLWQKYLGDELVDQLKGNLLKLVAQFNLTAPTIEAIASVAKFGLNKHSPIMNSLWNDCRVQARQKLDGLATRVTSNASWDNLILPDTTKQKLASIISQVDKRALVHTAWQFDSHRGSGITALFSGTSGTGKTTAAEVIANQLKLDLYKIELSTVISKYIGETEKNLRRIFDAAEAGGAILLFDEADALFGKRTEVKDSKDRHSNAEISYLLQKMEAYRGLAILTTNIEEAIDSAFKRRLKFVIKFDFPDATARENIWRSVFPNAAPTKNLNYSMLSTMELSGGNIRSIALNAAFLAAEYNEAIQMKHIVEAAKAEAQKLGSDTYQLEMMVAQMNMNQGQDNSSYNSSTSSFNNDDSYQLESSNNPIGENHPTNVPQPELSAKNHCWSPKDTLKQARSFFERGDYLKGYAIFTEGVTIYPNHSGLNFWMAYAVWEVRLNVPPQEIIAALDRAENGNGQWFDIEEGRAACWFLKARVMERFKLEGAKRCYDLYEKYIEAYPKGHHVETAKTRRNELAFEAKFGKEPED